LSLKILYAKIYKADITLTIP